jgi:glucose/mannose-6-phosphate isomerase
MYESILNFNKQFLYEPEIVNENFLIRKEKFIVVGMGGSALAVKILKTWKPEFDIIINSDYGLPKLQVDDLKSRLMILSSYSGSTEEVLQAFQEGKEESLNMVVISTGGKLLALAKENNIPYIELPNTGIQPRMATGFFVKALLKIFKKEELGNISQLAKTLNPSLIEEKGKDLAKIIKNYTPIIYSSNINISLSCIWKIKLNETGKIPAFYNVFPELNHNEMTSFDVTEPTKELCNKFYFIILKDKTDNPRIIKRMEILEKLYKNRNLKVETLELREENFWLRVFSSLILADWTAYHIALEYGLEAEKVPMVEEFKKLISS